MHRTSIANAPDPTRPLHEGRRRFCAWLAGRLQSLTAFATALLWPLMVFVSPMAGFANGDLSGICDQAAVRAASETGVPISVLRAITLTETGREAGGQTRPWPWTVNMEGEGVWFDTADSARAYAYEHYKRGARSFDVGCFQLNYKWHHEAFSSIEEMFDPTANAVYAARFLLELYSEMGNWTDAAGAYHSRTPEYADRYKARFAAFRAQFEHQDGLPLVVASAGPAHGLPDDVSDGLPAGDTVRTLRQPLPRVNSYPLLQQGGKAAIGSLVPLGAGGGFGSLFARGDTG